jgi:crotonobetaine/carnitine-CoA ligase
MLDNHIDHVLTWLGINVGAMVDVPINTAYKGEVLRYIVTDSNARTVIIEAGYLDRLMAIADLVPNLETVIVRGSTLSPADERFRWLDFDSLSEGGGVSPDPPAVWDVAGVIYTSGTEGPAKGVLCPHGQAYTSGSYPIDVGPDDVVLVTAPLFHFAGLWNGVYGALRDGATAVVVSSFSASTFWQQVRRFGCTTTLLLGAMAEFLLRQPASPDDRNHTLRRVTVIPATAKVDELADRFGLIPFTAYGSSEVGSICDPGPGRIAPFLIGTPRPHIRMKLVDENDVEVPQGQPGEILVRASEPWTMMVGYHNKLDVTNRAWRNLWFHTGDVGYQDADGSLYYVDRRNDALRRRGENISSAQVEEAVGAHPDIAEVAVVSVASDDTEHEIKAVVVALPGETVDFDALLTDLVARLPHFMVPRYYEQVSELPRTPTLKVRKDVLRAAGVTENTWDIEQVGLRVTRNGLTRRQNA